jgi:hypothetical protein
MNRDVLILDGGDESDVVAHRAADLARHAAEDRGATATLVRLHEKRIAPCAGCFGCWVKTPGVCVIDDEGRDVARQTVQSDIVVYVTPVLFGGYGPELKKALDRSIPTILPLFRTIHGEIHHVKRYDRYPAIVALGIQPDRDPLEEEIFESLVERNAINLHAPSSVVNVFSVLDDEETQRRRIDWALGEAIER